MARLAARAHGDRDLARLALLGLGVADLQYTAVKRGLDGLGIDPLRGA